MCLWCCWITSSPFAGISSVGSPDGGISKLFTDRFTDVSYRGPKLPESVTRRRRAGRYGLKAELVAERVKEKIYIILFKSS